MTSAQRNIADAILAGPRGASTGLEGPFDALLRSPRLAEPLQRVGEYLRFSSSLPARLNECAILITARWWSAQFEWTTHRRLAVEAGLEPRIIQAIERHQVPPDMDGPTSAVHDFTSQLLQSGGVDDRGFDRIVDYFGEEGAVDLIGVVGYYCLVSFLLNVDRYPLPSGEVPLGD